MPSTHLAHPSEGWPHAAHQHSTASCAGAPQGGSQGGRELKSSLKRSICHQPPAALAPGAGTAPPHISDKSSSVAAVRAASLAASKLPAAELPTPSADAPPPVLALLLLLAGCVQLERLGEHAALAMLSAACSARASAYVCACARRSPKATNSNTWPEWGKGENGLRCAVLGCSKHPRHHRPEHQVAQRNQIGTML